MKSGLVIFLFAFSLAYNYGCKTYPAGKNTKVTILAETQIETRIADFMKACKTASPSMIYSFLSPQFRAEVSLQAFSENPSETRSGMLCYRIQGIDIVSDSEAKVWIVEYTKPSGLPSFLLTRRLMKWIRTDNEWFLEKEQEDNSIPPSSCGGSFKPVETKPSESNSACGK